MITMATVSSALQTHCKKRGCVGRGGVSPSNASLAPPPFSCITTLNALTHSSVFVEIPFIWFFQDFPGLNSHVFGQALHRFLQGSVMQSQHSELAGQILLPLSPTPVLSSLLLTFFREGSSLTAKRHSWDAKVFYDELPVSPSAVSAQSTALSSPSRPVPKKAPQEGGMGLLESAKNPQEISGQHTKQAKDQPELEGASPACPQLD